MQRRVLATAVVLFGTMLAACGGYGAGYYNYGPPPPPRYGAMGYAPRPGYVWMDGYWDRGPRNWMWRDGRWAHPPRGRREWVRPEWRNEHGRWRLQRGYWR